MLDERDKQLIKEREDYENNFLEDVVDEMIESDALDELIAQRFKYIDNHFDFEPSPEYLKLEKLYYQQFDPHYLKEQFQDYMPHDNLSDNLNDFDYPDSPDEDSILELEPFIDTDDEYLDVPDFEESEAYDEMLNEYLKQPPEYVREIFYEDNIEEVFEYYLEEDETRIKIAINEYLQQEKDYFDSLLVEVIQEEHYFEKAIDELILEHADKEYDPEDFDYVIDPDYPDYWFEEPDEYPTYWQGEDESIKDPFDSFDEIDYPEGEPAYHCEAPIQDYHEELQRDYAKFEGAKRRQLAKKRQAKEFKDDLENKQLIGEFDSLVKDVFTKDDNLDKMIKNKLKEKKFNQ